MPAIVDKVVLGREQVDAYLARLPEKVRSRSLRRGLYAAAVMIREEARRTVPVRDGFLKRQIAARSGRRRAGGEMVAYTHIARGRFVSTRNAKGKTRYVKTNTRVRDIKTRYKNPRRYAHLVEWGRDGVAGQPFLGPAAAKLGTRALQAIADRIRDDLVRGT